MFHNTCGRKGRFARVMGMALAISVTLSGCSTVSDWFADEEELEIRRLKPIDAKFTPSVKWDRDIGDGVDHYFSRLRPVYAYENLYAADRHGSVVAMNPENGDVLWERNFAVFEGDGWWDSIARLWRSGASARIGGISVADRLLFVGTENGAVMALDYETGETKWEASIPGEVLAAPSADEGILVVNTGAGTLFGFDTRTGEQLWRHEGDTPPLTLRGISGPVAANGGALIGTPTGKLQVNLLESGILAWETVIATPTGATELERIVDLDTTPVLFGGTIYTVSYNGTLAAVELRSGRIIWKREYGSYRNLSIEGNSIFVVDNNSNIYALDRRNGVELWSQGGLKSRSVTAATPVGEHIVVGDNWGFVHWIEQETGQIVARVDVGGDDEDDAIYDAPLNVDGVVVTMTRNGVVAAISTL
ncbi:MULTISPECIES: outer membrane protein assembly factor BamB [Alteromonas]|uniref:Outer membrane protein assembly factor BamB n=2 Tax=Alteromonas stellipolaris TaxID=233316 RepID=A0AAW7Z562_9ALTE|nr:MULTISPECIES: outer membrane protein assembly factor BamB [Alteromonas]ALM89843.1 Outer membrane protein YfgL [Alteromonas stellipolaris LMG 21856]MBZ2161832.1 outer membrane protein assembly factor BamB [Alteromonas stellipolaris]MDO6533296.1 outer membrane protein assembly factor BamB [Alteromonas stellipolaris]MDO6537711.1 outer membrane protein assembly factor BamB [Alteromonas stellipolaris]MDO6577771.1 outer membrane protein assembly factor BamB [Alteromonas stellipolaris]